MSQQDVWEYKSLVVETDTFWSSGKIDAPAIDDHLAPFGDSGWELAVAVPVSSHEGSTSRILFTFKRLRQSASS